MDKTRKNLILLCMMLVVCSIGCGDWQGRSLSDWEADLKDSDPMKRAEAASALGNIGSAGVPGLIQALSDESPLVRTKAAEALEWCGPSAAPAVEPLTKLLADKSTEVQEAAVKTLGAIGPDAKDALPALQKVFQEASKQRNSELRQSASEAMELINS